MKTNTPVARLHTHEGAVAKHISPGLQLRRSVMSCMLWESEFYEDGVTVASRIASLIPLVDAEIVADMAIEARSKMKLRHVPLMIVREMARLATHRHLVAKTLEAVIQRPDELAEFLAIYWKDGRQPLSHQVKKGLALAFNKFNAFGLAKYNRDGAVKLRDVLFLCHAKPKDSEQEQAWKQLVENKLPVPDTWEVALSGGSDKKATFERLISEGQLGALAMLRNLRKMTEVGVNQAIIKNGLQAMRADRVLPFRFIAAARHAPQFEPQLEVAMNKCTATLPRLYGRTCLLVDVSGSMDMLISSKSDMARIDAACGLAILLREICLDVDVLTFSAFAVVVPARRGFALRDAIVQSQPHASTNLGSAINAINKGYGYDRLIVITDEQSQDTVSDPATKGYVINVASAKNGVGYGPWNHIDGWSESVIDFIQEFEQ